MSRESEFPPIPVSPGATVQIPIEPDPAVIERMARAMAVSWPGGWDDMERPVQASYRMLATRAYAALATPAEGKRT